MNEETSRVRVIARGLLRYLYGSTSFRPSVAGFWESGYLPVDDSPVTEEELARVIAGLQRQGLVVTGTREGANGDVSVRAGLTGAGLICAGDHDGDVQRWQQAVSANPLDEPERDVCSKRGESAGDAVGRNKTARGPQFAGLARVARVLLLALPCVSVAERDQNGVERAASALLEAAQQPEPDTPTVRKLAAQLREGLTTGPLAATLGVVLLDGLEEALGTPRAQSVSSGGADVRRPAGLVPPDGC